MPSRFLTTIKTSLANVTESFYSSVPYEKFDSPDLQAAFSLIRESVEVSPDSVHIGFLDIDSSLADGKYSTRVKLPYSNPEKITVASLFSPENISTFIDLFELLQGNLSIMTKRSYDHSLSEMWRSPQVLDRTKEMVYTNLKEGVVPIFDSLDRFVNGLAHPMRSGSLDLEVFGRVYSWLGGIAASFYESKSIVVHVAGDPEYIAPSELPFISVLYTFLKNNFPDVEVSFRYYNIVGRS